MRPLADEYLPETYVRFAKSTSILPDSFVVLRHDTDGRNHGTGGYLDSTNGFVFSPRRIGPHSLHWMTSTGWEASAVEIRRRSFRQDKDSYRIDHLGRGSETDSDQ